MSFNSDQNRSDIIQSSITLIESTFELAQFHDPKYQSLMESEDTSDFRKYELWQDFRTMRLRIIRGDCHDEVALDLLKKYPQSLYLTSDSLVTPLRQQFPEYEHQITAGTFFDNPEDEESEFKTALTLAGGLDLILIDRSVLCYNDFECIRNLNATLSVFLGDITVKTEFEGGHTELTKMI